jgi:hypothetical protein
MVRSVAKPRVSNHEADGQAALVSDLAGDDVAEQPPRLAVEPH